MLSYANFSAIWNGIFYVLAIDYNRYVISKLCSDDLHKGKNIYWRN